MGLLAHAVRRTQDLAQRAVPANRLIYRGPPTARRVALTFDDGPDELTPGYLDVLDRHGVPATFFVMGDLCEVRPRAVGEYRRRGHQIGGHGYDHTRFTALSWRALDDQLDRTADKIGPVPEGRLWVRPPYGQVDARSLTKMWARGHVVAMWSLDSRDYGHPEPDLIAARCAPDQVEPGEVLLFHEGHQHTIDALPTIIERLQADGYELVTMADLIAT
jgi:peptidoglycan/xylan/chitin deacetylase (PgdA/CDA1 family)